MNQGKLTVKCSSSPEMPVPGKDSSWADWQLCQLTNQKDGWLDSQSHSRAKNHSQPVGEVLGNGLDALRCSELCKALRHVGTLTELRAEQLRLSQWWSALLNWLSSTPLLPGSNPKQGQFTWTLKHRKKIPKQNSSLKEKTYVKLGLLNGVSGAQHKSGQALGLLLVTL